MYTGMLQRFDPDDPRWGAAPSRLPEVFISAERESLKARRLSCALVSYDWVVDGGTDSARPDEAFDTSDVEVLDVEGADTIRFEIHSSASPVSITVTRLFDLDADNPEDFESIAHLLSPGQPEPDGLELRRVESEGDPHWRLDVQIVPVQEASHISLQALLVGQADATCAGIHGCMDSRLVGRPQWAEPSRKNRTSRQTTG